MKIIDETMYYTLSEVCAIIGKTKATILRWYEYESQLPEDERILPQYIELGETKAKYFNANDIDLFRQFKHRIKRGEMKTVSDKYNGELTKQFK